MREGVAICLLFLFLANALMVSGNGGADEARSGAHGRATSRAVTIIYNVYDLQNMSMDLNGAYELANDIDASDTVNWNSGAGFAPVGNQTYSFNGTLDGKNYTITGLFINRPETGNVGLFGYAGKDSSMKNIGVVNGNVTGNYSVGGLVGYDYYGTVENSYFLGNVNGGDWYQVGGLVGYSNHGMVNKSYVSGNVRGNRVTGGLVGENYHGYVNDSYVSGNVSGDWAIGGLAGYDEYGTVNNSYFVGNLSGNGTVGGILGIDFWGLVINSHASGNVTGTYSVGGVVGRVYGSHIKNSYFTGSVNGTGNVGGIVGEVGFDWLYIDPDSFDMMSNSHYNIDEVSINGGHHVTIGGLFDAQYQDWFSNGLTLNISDYSNALVPSGGYYNISNVQGLRDLLGFAEFAKYSFRLASDIDLSNDSGLYIPYLAAVFDGDNHTISNLNLNLSFDSFLGMFGIDIADTIMNIGILNDLIEGYDYTGGLVGSNWGGTVNNSYATGNVTGTGDYAGYVGGLVGHNLGTVNNTYATVNVTEIGNNSEEIGGLVGFNGGTVNNSYATGNVNASSMVGGLVGINHGVVVNSYAAANVSGIEAVGGLVGESSYGGSGRGAFNEGTIINSYATGDVNGTMAVGGLAGNSWLALVTDSFATGNVSGNESVGGLMGAMEDSTLSRSYATGNVNGSSSVGGLVGGCANELSYSVVNLSYATGNVTGDHDIGGLVGFVTDINFFHKIATVMVNNSYATGKVTGDHNVGGLVGNDSYGILSNSYSAGNVTGNNNTGGLVGFIANCTVSNCFWDNETSGRNSSSGGTGKTTAEMKTESTFTSAGWDFNNIWCMVENVTYPVFKWQLDILPKAIAGPDQTVYEGTLVTLDGRSSTDGVEISNYTWAFYDGTGDITLHGVAPSHTFNVAGVYSVVLNITDAFGRWNTDSLTVTVKKFPQPIADAGPDQTVDVGALVTFNGSGSTAGAGIINYTWTFNDGTGNIELYGAAPSHAFNVPGVYTVTLNITDARGDWAIDGMNVTVKDVTPPAADAGPDLVEDQGTLVTFDGRASMDNVGIVNYSWEFFDGGPVTLYGVRPAYRFDHPGIFVVTLTVTDAAGNVGTDTMTVTVKDITVPVADAGPDRTVEAGSPITLDGSRSSDNVGVVNYSWDLIDGAPVTIYGVRPAYRFNHPGIFVVTLIATDAAGNWGTDTMTVTVNDTTAPVAEAGPERTVDGGTVVTFDGSASSDNVGIVDYTWTFVYGSDKFVLHRVSAQFTFVIPGIYSIRLNVSDAAGFWAEDTMLLTVRDVTPPFADAGPDQTVNEKTSVMFNGSGSSDNVGIVNYTWTFDCGTQKIVLYGVSPSFSFIVPGLYHVQLNVSDAAGFRGEDVMTLTVKDITPPVANAGRDQRVLEGSTVMFDGSRSTDNCGVEKYFWNFTYDGKAQSLEGKKVSFKFDKAGVYVVVLTVVDGAGNRGEDRVVITVEPKVNIMPGLLSILVLLIAVSGIASYVVTKKRKARKGGPSQSLEEPAK